jgi:hypothetical protein
MERIRPPKRPRNSSGPGIYRVSQEEPIIQMGTDRMIPRHVSDKTFTVRFPDRSEWKDGFQPDRCTDGSMTNALGLGCMVMVQVKYTTVFQVELHAVKSCTVENLDRDYNIETSIFYQAAMLGLKHMIITRSTKNRSGTANNPS